MDEKRRVSSQAVERKASDVCLGSCPFDFVASGRRLLVCFFVFVFLRVHVSFGNILNLILNLIALMWSCG